MIAKDKVQWSRNRLTWERLVILFNSSKAIEVFQLTYVCYIVLKICFTIYCIWYM
jgi:hypothetical protein